MINAEVNKNSNENSASLLRRFSRRVQGTGVIQKAKGNKYRKRVKSRHTVKKETLVKLERRSEVEKLIKLGKLPDKRRGANRR
jgi:ribosomal protein S21